MPRHHDRPHHPDRRLRDDPEAARIRTILEYELDRRLTFKKNGDSVGGYLKRLITPERVFWFSVWLLSMSYRAGGEVTRYVGQGQEVANIKAQYEVVLKELDELDEANRESAKRQAEMVERQQNMPTSAEVAALRDRLATSVTRKEFNEAIYSTVQPRLERIEKQISSKE